jgi:hypothetical protein
MKAAAAATIFIALAGVTPPILAGSPEQATDPAETRSRVQPAHLAALQYRGLAIQVRTGYEPLQHYEPLFRDIAGLGASSVLLCPAGYKEHAESQQIFIDARKTPAREDFKAVVRAARAHNLRVILMPMILLAKPRGSEWRGVIRPPDWDDWWEQYRDFITYFCEIAREGPADALIVGSELVSTEKSTSRWLEVIDLARTHFHGGQLGYSANWDHYEPIKFWHKLDFIGLTSYFTLADRRNPSVDEIVQRWTPIRDEVLRWQRKIGKPLVFTEVGWCSQEGAAMAPWNYYQSPNATPAGHQEQRRLYQAFLNVWDGTPGVAGIIWWEWSAHPGGDADFGYTPRNKPAEHVLRDWFAKYQPVAATQPSPPDPTDQPDEQP